MKKVLLVVSILLLAGGAAFAKEPVSQSRFKRYMHEIFKNYRNTNIAIDMRNYALTDVHLRHFSNNLAKIPGLAGDLKADGVKIDDAVFRQRLETLRAKIGEARETVKAQDPAKIKTIPHDLLAMCIGCHSDAQLKWLFRLPVSANLFEDYMHEISDNIGTAELFLGEREPDEASDYLMIANQYLTLLQNVYPYMGPSGIILDRNRFTGELRKVEGLCLLMQEDLKMKKTADLAGLKKHLNNVCVACHQPEMIK